MEQNINLNIRGLLLCKGISVEKFATQNRFNKWTVYKAIKNWWGKKSLPRKGSKAFKIMLLLKKECSP